MGRYAEVEAVLSEYSGLDIESIGRQTFERSVESRVTQAFDGSYAGYLESLKAEEDELARLLDLLLVPETWFFRDAGTFAFLAAFVKTEWRSRRDGGILQILSAPCSTGEEPYSIAMTLLESGLQPSQFRIHACDISPKALSAAKAARYAHASFRSPLTAVQSRFFVRGGESATVSESVQSLVTFSRGNLVDPNFLTGTENLFDVIFCKNLMIYLGEAGRAKVIAALSRLLRENGLLFVGHSEVALFHKAGYTPVASAKAFGLTKAKRQPAVPAPPPRRRIPRTRAGEAGAPAKVGRIGGQQADSLEKAVEMVSTRPLLETARSLADRGDLEAAANVCRSLIGENVMDVGAYYLAGLIEQSQDRLAPAEDFFMKAIYLDPEHYDTLVQLCLLSEKRGDSAKAGQYRKRIERLVASAKRE